MFRRYKIHRSNTAGGERSKRKLSISGTADYSCFSRYGKIPKKQLRHEGVSRSSSTPHGTSLSDRSDVRISIAFHLLQSMYLPPLSRKIGIPPKRYPGPCPTGSSTNHLG